MGIYVQTYAKIPPSIVDALLPERIVAASRAWAEDKGLAGLFYGRQEPDRALVSFYPPDGALAFEIARSGVTIDAKTSVAGPGFHAALIDLCDALERMLGLEWNWRAGGDETGFAISRDRGALQEAFLGQFTAFCDHYRRSGAAYDYKLNLELGLAVGVRGGVATPLGVHPLSLFTSCANDDRESLVDAARSVFPWWSDQLGREFWTNALSALLWTQVEWRRPTGPSVAWEEHVHAAALHAAERARQCGAALSNEVNQGLRQIASMTPEMTPPGEGIGYRRGDRAFDLGGPWTIDVPAYYVFQTEEDGAACLWFGTEEIRGTSFTYTPKDPGELVWSSHTSADDERATNGFQCRLRPEISPLSAGDGFIMFAECSALDNQGRGHLLVLSLTDSRSDLAARLETLTHYVRFQSPQVLPTAPRNA